MESLIKLALILTMMDKNLAAILVIGIGFVVVAMALTKGTG